MSEYFGKYKRPKQEIKLIQNFVRIFTLSKKYYKQKNYKKALSGFIAGYELIEDIFDIYPKLVTIILIIKSNFHLNKLNDCYTFIEKIKQFFPILLKYKRELFIKYKPKIFLYEFILDFICEKLEQSISYVTEFISYLITTDVFFFCDSLLLELILDIKSRNISLQLSHLYTVLDLNLYLFTAYTLLFDIRSK